MTMSRPTLPPAALLLGLLVPGAAAFVLLTSVARGLRPAAARSNVAPGGAIAAASAPACSSGQREPLARTPCATSRAHRSGGAPSTVGGREPRREREFLAGFLALEHAHPGALAERAETLLAGDGPGAEKVAFLRALGESDGEAHLRWLEHAVRALPDDSGPHGVSVTRYALGELATVARTEPEALQALRRLAFETRDLAPDLRRSAALGLARFGDEAQLGELRVALAREDDELLTAGVLAALSERPDSRQSVRLLCELSPSSSSARN